MKRSPLRRRARKPSLRKLKKAADDACFAYFRGLPCFICGSTNRTAGHHLIPKSRSLRHRHSFENIIPLCPTHHTFGADICAHGQSSLAVGRFLAVLRANDPARYSWMITHEYDECHYKTADWADIAQYWRDVAEKRYSYEWMMRKCGLDPHREEESDHD